MSARNRVSIIAFDYLRRFRLVYYLVSTPSNKDLVLIGTVDSNQVIVSPQVEGRLAKLLVDEGTQVKQGDLIAVLDPSELEAEARAAAATIDSLQSKVRDAIALQQAMAGSTSSSVANAQAKLRIHARAIAASGSYFAAHRKRQPPHD